MRHRHPVFLGAPVVSAQLSVQGSDPQRGGNRGAEHYYANAPVPDGHAWTLDTRAGAFGTAMVELSEDDVFWSVRYEANSQYLDYQVELTTTIIYYL